MLLNIAVTGELGTANGRITSMLLNIPVAGELGTANSIKGLVSSRGSCETKRREVVLDPQVSPEEIKSREVELGLRAGLLSLQLFPKGGASDIVFADNSAI